MGIMGRLAMPLPSKIAIQIPGFPRHKLNVKVVDTVSKQEQHEIRKPTGWRLPAFERDDLPGLFRRLILPGLRPTRRWL